ncbi:MAG: hypothetical protein KGZ50_10490, partial [Peptococcaceae bacterium]|nr:hypothetical protein [Peptococcaceae bacterium]
GLVKEMDDGFAASMAPSAEISTELWAIQQVQSMPLTVDGDEKATAAAATKTITQSDSGLEAAVHGDECTECHGVQWYRIGDEFGIAVRNEKFRPHK